MIIRLCTNVIKFVYLLYPTQSLDIVVIHITQIIFKYFFNTTTEEGIFNDDGNLFQSELPLN